MKAYRHSGRIDPISFAVLPFYLVLAGIFGFLYQLLLDANVFLMLNAFVPLLLGPLLGITALATLRQGRVRNHALARVVVWSIVLFGWLIAHGTALGLFSGHAGDLWQQLAQKLREGDPIPGQKSFVPPSMLVLSWLFELGLLLLSSIPIAYAWWNKAVFSEEEGRFLERERIAVRYGPTPKSIYEAVEAGGLDALLRFQWRKLPENAEEAELRFYRQAGSSERYLSLHWVGKREGPRGRKILRDLVVLSRIPMDAAFEGHLMDS